MWELAQIPKVLHAYWGNTRLPLLRYLTLKSFADLNPDWEVKLWVPREKSADLDTPWTGPSHKGYSGPADTNLYGSVSKIDNLEVDIYEFPEEFRSVSEVFKSDYLRLDLLSREGGFWADMDILFLKPMDELTFNGHNSLIDTIVCHSWDDYFSGHSIGFLGAAPGSGVFEELAERASKFFDARNYQSIGRDLFDRFCSHERIANSGRIFNFDRRVVYPLNYFEVREIVAAKKIDLPKETIGIHWYAGDPQMGSCCKHVTEAKVKQGGCFFYDEARKFI